MRFYRLWRIIVPLVICSVALGASTQAQSDSILPIWQAGNGIHDALFEAQQAMLNADGAADATTYTQQAVDAVQKAETLYQQVIQPALRSDNEVIDQAITQALSDAQNAASQTNARAFAYASGLVWTTLLRGSYEMTFAAIQAGDSPKAMDWLRLREYRQATRFSLVDDPAAQAIARLLPCSTNLDDVLTSVSNDLRDAYTFRLRDALTKVKDAAGQNFTIRSADWAGRLNGYFAILQSDFAAKRGETETTNLQTALDELKTAALKGDLQAVSLLSDQIKTGFANYEPFALTLDDVAKRAQLLYLYIDLTHVEYALGVQDGKVTIPIEMQEAVTFMNQAIALAAELRPIMQANDSNATDMLNTQLDQMKGLITTVGNPNDLQILSNAALESAGQALKVAAKPTDIAAAYTVINTMLKELKSAVLSGDYATAESKRLKAYTILNAGIEQRLHGLLPDMAIRVDNLFWQGKPDQPGLSLLLARHASPDEVQTGLDQLNIALSTSQSTLNVARPSRETLVSNTALVVFLSGLEAVLILSSFLAVLRGFDGRRYRRSLIFGAGLAIVGAVIIWLVFSSILPAVIGLVDRLETITSLIAIVLLLMIFYWVLRQAGLFMRKDNLNRQNRVRLGNAAIIVPSIGLLFLGFTSVFRSVIETVPYLQTLLVNTDSSVLLEAVGLGILAIMLVGVLIFGILIRLPYKRVLIVMGVLITVVGMMILGNTVHALQVAAWLPITPIDGVYPSYWSEYGFGIYATWQGIILQISVVAFVIGSYLLTGSLQQKKHEAKTIR